MKQRITIAAAAVACAACSADPVTAPRDVAPQLSVGTLAPAYGFFAQPGNTSASVITDGGLKTCVQFGSGSGRFVLPLTPGILSNVRAVLAAGGSAEVEVNTKFRYVGTGRLNARETIDVLSNGGSIGSATAKGSAVDPGYLNGGVIATRSKKFPVTLASFTTGGQLEVNLTGNVTAVLPQCVVPFGGFVKWSYSMPILRLTP